MADGNYSTTVRVCETRRPESYWVLTSEDLPGFMLTGKNLDALRADMPAVIKAFFRLNYQLEMDVRRVVSPRAFTNRAPNEEILEYSHNWAAFPTAHLVAAQ